MAFISCSLIHTKNGLVPIQDLKVGDMVLSRKNNPKGELVYKPIIRTFKSETKQPVMAPVVFRHNLY